MSLSQKVNIVVAATSTVIDDTSPSDLKTYSSRKIEAIFQAPALSGDMTKARYDTGGLTPTGDKVDAARNSDHATTADTATNISIADNTISDVMIGNRTADPYTTTAYALLGSPTQWFSWITKRFEQALGYAWGVTIPFSLKTLAEQADINTLFIPAGGTFSPYTWAGRNRMYNTLYVKCQANDATGTLQNPTSLIVYIYVNDVLQYTSSSAITTATTTATISLSINAGDNIKYVISNTTGLTGGVSIGIKQVNR